MCLKEFEGALVSALFEKKGLSVLRQFKELEGGGGGGLAHICTEKIHRIKNLKVS